MAMTSCLRGPASCSSCLALVVLCFVVACDNTYLRPVSRRRCEDSPTGSPAANASSFLDSLGFNMRLADLLAPGPDGRTPSHHLRALGVRHLRDGAIDDARVTDPIAQALSADGVKLLFQLSLRTNFQTFWASTRGFVEAVQVPSPANDFLGPYPYGIEEVPPAAARLRAAVDALAEAERPLLVGPIIFQDADAAAVGDLGASLDYGGFRASIGDVEPARTYAGWAQRALVISGGKPLLATKLTYMSGARAANDPGLTPDLQAKYVVRMLLESFRQGVVRTYYDHLYDGTCEDAACRGGLLAADGTPKTAYEAWKTVVDVVRVGTDAVSGAKGAHLPYKLETSSPADVHTVLLHRGDGAFVLILWLEVRGANGRDITQTATLSLEQAVADITANDLRNPTAQAMRLGPGPTYDVTISDAPLLLTIKTTCE